MIIPIKCFTCGNVLADKYRYYQDQVRRMKIEKGLQIDKVVYLTKTNIEKTTILELLFADDAAVCATSEEDLNIIIQTFYEVFADFALQMALKKTVIMLQRPTSNPNLTDSDININSKTLQVVNKFKYFVYGM